MSHWENCPTQEQVAVYSTSPMTTISSLKLFNTKRPSFYRNCCLAITWWVSVFWLPLWYSCYYCAMSEVSLCIPVVVHMWLSGWSEVNESVEVKEQVWKCTSSPRSLKSTSELFFQSHNGSLGEVLIHGSQFDDGNSFSVIFLFLVYVTWCHVIFLRCCCCVGWV